MKTKITLAIAASLLAGCAQINNNEELNTRLANIEMNQRLIANQVGLSQVTMPKTIDYMDGIRIGDSNAPLVMIEFTDLECPYCSTFQTEVFPDFKKNYIDTGEILYVAKELPLKQIHKNAASAAIALRCVNAQDPNLYSNYKTTLFSNQKELSPEFYNDEAIKLGLDIAKFEQCQNSDEQIQSVDTSYKYAFGLGLSSTPAFIFGKNEKNSASNYFIANGSLKSEHIEEALKQLRDSLK